jgi:transmembrane sensor
MHRPLIRMDRMPTPTDVEAARWVVRLDAGELSDEEQRELNAWLTSAPHHHGALVRARAVWGDLDRLGAIAGGSSRDEPVVPAEGARALAMPKSTPITRRSRRWWLSAAAAACLVVAGVTWFATVSGRQVYESDIGEVRRLTLADGSTMVLNTASRAVVRFTDATREVQLERGEALFEVQKNKRRPFIVRTGEVSVRAVGTAFAVRVGEARVDVTVTEGVVELTRASGVGPGAATPEPPARLAANEHATVRATGAVAIESVAPPVVERHLAWRNGVLAFNGETLGEAVEEINRHNHRQIVIDDAALSARPVVGIFRANDIDGFAQAAAAALGASAHEEGDIIRLTTPKPN